LKFLSKSESRLQCKRERCFQREELFQGSGVPVRPRRRLSSHASWPAADNVASALHFCSSCSCWCRGMAELSQRTRCWMLAVAVRELLPTLHGRCAVGAAPAGKRARLQLGLPAARLIPDGPAQSSPHPHA